MQRAAKMKMKIKNWSNNWGSLFNTNPNNDGMLFLQKDTSNSKNTKIGWKGNYLESDNNLTEQGTIIKNGNVTKNGRRIGEETNRIKKVKEKKETFSI